MYILYAQLYNIFWILCKIVQLSGIMPVVEIQLPTHGLSARKTAAPSFVSRFALFYRMAQNGMAYSVALFSGMVS